MTTSFTFEPGDHEAAEVLRAFLRAHGFDTKTETDYAKMLHQAVTEYTERILSALGRALTEEAALSLIGPQERESLL